MLKEIYIENLAIIKKVTIALGEGLNLFTGETGAGKSILINGINAILGVRTSKDLVRTGENKAIISALFTNISDKIIEILSENGISADEKQITLTREIFSDGGTVARLNGRVVNISLLREVAELLVNIHGQHDNQILLNPEKHIEILDSFCNNEKYLSEYEIAFKELQDCAKEISKIKKQLLENSSKIEEIQEKTEEIDKLKLKPDEDKLIEKEYEVAENAENIFTRLKNAKVLLTGENNVFDLLRLAETEISYIENFAPGIRERLTAAKIEVKDLGEEVTSLLKTVDLDDKKLEYLKNRRSEIFKITKKYNLDVNGLIELAEKLKADSENLDTGNLQLQKLSEKRDELLKTASIKAKELSQFREDNSKILIEKITNELEFLNMPDITFEVRNEKGKLTLKGIDNIEFLISANKGELPKPIAKIASGGELSRIMLALKNVLNDSIPTLIFDEIDTGVSGKAAQKIGIKLKEISKKHQVLCVTHLAQIAAQGDTHFLIEKKNINEHTETNVTELDSDRRVSEIARIIGGENISELMLQNAKEMLQAVK
jgi:DNA repair protein RecN (Recombination protein N)